MLSSKIILQLVKNTVLNVMPKFYADRLNNVKVTAIQSLENMFRVIRSSHVGEQVSALQPIFPCNTIENV